MKRIPTDIVFFRADLRRAMSANNDTQEGVGRTVGVSQAVICNFLTGKRGLSGDSVFKIMAYVYPETWPPAQEPPQGPNDAVSTPVPAHQQEQRL